MTLRTLVLVGLLTALGLLLVASALPWGPSQVETPALSDVDHRDAPARWVPAGEAQVPSVQRAVIPTSGRVPARNDDESMGASPLGRLVGCLAEAVDRESIRIIASQIVDAMSVSDRSALIGADAALVEVIRLHRTPFGQEVALHCLLEFAMRCEIGSESLIAVRGLIESHPRERVRAGCAWLSARALDLEERDGFLMELLADHRSPLVRGTAADAIAVLSVEPIDASMVNRLLGALAAESQPDVRQSILRAFCQRSVSHPRAVLDVLAELARSEPHPEGQLQYLLAAAEIGGEEALGILREWEKDPVHATDVCRAIENLAR